MKISKKLFGALLFTCFLGFSQMTSAQTTETNKEEKTEDQAKVQAKSQYEEGSEVKEDKAKVKAKDEEAVQMRKAKEVEEMNGKKE